MLKWVYEDLWFVANYYAPAGRPKLEDDVARHSREEYLHALVSRDDIQEIMHEIEAYQNKQWERNKRLKKADVHLSRPGGPADDIIWLYIGASHLTLQKVKKASSFI